MFFSKETRIKYLNWRIKTLRARGEVKNLRVIAALTRELRGLEEESN